MLYLLNYLFVGICNIYEEHAYLYVFRLSCFEILKLFVKFHDTFSNLDFVLTPQLTFSPFYLDSQF